MMRSPALRPFVLGLCFFAAAGFSARAMRAEQVPLHAPLGNLPNQIGAWSGEDTPPFAENVLTALGVDAYVSRIYATDAAAPVALYVGYYASQRTGDTIHSPQNCLPGAGWLPVHNARVDIPVAGRPSPLTVNRLVIQKGLEQQVVLYWYQSRGRVVASDYWSKVYLVYDAARYHRSDAAMVRVISPVMAGEASVEAAERRAAEFTSTMFSALERLLPA